MMRLLLLILCLAAMFDGPGRMVRADGLFAVEDTVDSLVWYVEEHYRTPEQYVLSKFDHHDIIFMGEQHRIRHDVALVRALIPRLYDNGVYNLGTEFANFADQSDIDRLITDSVYDESLARLIQFNQWPYWGYQDYIDIYRAAWQFNCSLVDGQRPFRIVGLNARRDFSFLWSAEDRQNPELKRKIWPEGTTDQHMAQVILREFVGKNEKALVYCGINHAYTRYRQPQYNIAADTLYGLVETRAGNIVYDSIGDRAFLICLHHPWPSASSRGSYVRAADGYIDHLLEKLSPEHRRAGFDVVGTPFENLPGDFSFWNYGHPDFRLGDYCDGYIIQGRLTSYQGVRVAAGFINKSNRLDAAIQNPNPRTKDSTTSVDLMMESIRREAEIQRKFKTRLRNY